MSKCEKCDKEFETDAALEQHNKAKHPEPEKQSTLSTRQKKKIRNWFILSLVTLALIFGIYFIASNTSSCKELPAKDLVLRSHNNVVTHIHPVLSIFIDGKRQGIPANIGVETDFMRALHTHDSSGKLHIESPCSGRTDFTLGEFFEVWEEAFYKEGMKVKMLVNGKDTPELENYVLKDLDDIRLEYTTNKN
jgi:hypothetical protein